MRSRPTAIRDDLAVKLQAVDVGDRDAVEEAIAVRLEQAKAKLTLYNRLREDLLQDRTEDEYLRNAERIGPYLTLMGGRVYEQQNIRWCAAVLEVLAERSRRGARTASTERRADAAPG